MDLKSFYKKIDVDSIKNKLPQLKIPKIKSRKIFKSSREDLAQQQSPAEPSMGVASPVTPKSLPEHSHFIDRTPTRISTVSSLMNLNYGFKDKHESGLSTTYKTASNFEEENCPDEFDTREPVVSGNSVSRLSDKCKKTYKDFSEFKIKNIFAKKTVVKRTEIEVDIYARQYERDNYLEQRILENQLEEDGYEFEFKEARRRLSVSSRSISPADSIRSGVPSPIRSELAHLQQNETPPLLAKRRNAISHAEALRHNFHRSVSSENIDQPPKKPNRSSLWGLNENNHAESGEEQVQVHRTSDSRFSKFKKSMKEGISDGIRESMSADSGDDRPRIGISMARFKNPTSYGKNIPAESGDEQPSTAPRAGPSRIARFKKSMKDGISEGFSDKNIAGQSEEENPSTNKAGTSRMARFKKSMKDGISEGFSDKRIPAESGDEQPSTAPRAGPSRMARFKKSMKDGISEGFSDKHITAESGDDQPPANKPGTSRMARFKNSMKGGISESALDRNMPAESGDEQPQAAQKGTSRMARFKKSMKEGISEGFSDKNIPAESGDEQPRASASRMSKFKKSMKEGMSHEFDSTNWNMKGIRNRFTSEDTDHNQKPKKNLQSQESLDEYSDHEKKTWKLSNIHLRRGEPAEKGNEPVISSPEGKFASIKMSIHSLKNRKPQRQTSEESETEQNAAAASPKQNMADQLKAGLRRLKKRDRSLAVDEEETKTPAEPASSRLRNWKKSIKLKRASEVATEDNGEEAPPLPASSPPGRSLTLMRKLNHIRSRKVASEDGEDSADPSQGNDQLKPKSSNLEKLEQARTKALRKVNAQVQKMKNFHGKSRDSPSEASPENKAVRKTTKSEHGAKDNTSKPLTTVLSSNSLESALSVDDDEEIPRALPEKALRTTKMTEHRSKPPITVMHSHSMESSLSLDGDDNDEEEIPRVFLHQADSDQYESTLIVSVTRPAPPVPTAVIKEIIPKTKYQAPKTEWIPNKNAISSFLEMTPSPESSTKQLDVSRGHLRKRSMDSNDSDSWIPDNFRNKSCSSSTIVGLNKTTENSAPWKVHSVFSEEKLYKAKSIDIFANRDGGAFRDFDDEMKNVPVRRITADSAESLNKGYGDSTDDDDDYDNSSRVTRVKPLSPMVNTNVAIETIRSGNLYESTDSNKAYRGSPVPNKKAAQIGNSQESLDANYDENDEISSDEEEEDDEETPTIAPSPPPSFSPPPPPLPLRKPPRAIPERNDSMVRLAHPLVKQGSLRRHFSEEIEPSDLGKVNKLITRFEKNPTYENVPRIQLIASDDDNGNFEVEEQKSSKTDDNDTKKGPVQYSSNVDIHSLEREEQNRPQTREDGGCGKNDEDGNFEPKKVARSSSKRRPAPIPNQTIRCKDDSSNNNNNIKNEIRTNKEQPASPSPEFNENLDNVSIQSPNSIYGSPIGSICLSERISTSSIYGSPIGAAYQTTNTTNDHQVRSKRRLSNRSSLRDDDTFYSFESDEENNFYSLGDSSDMRYTIEI